MQFYVLAALLCAGIVAAAPPKPQSTTTSTTTTESPPPPASSEEIPFDPQNYPAPQIDWGKCPQLKPSDADKEQKRIVIEKCLEQNPPPAIETITDPKQIDTHREVVTTCALKNEGWFNDDGTYKFDKAKAEIESKKLDKEVEKNISSRHEECKEESVKKYPKGYIEQVQLYQACMDYHIAEICQIELIPHPDFPVEMYLDDDVPSEEILSHLLPEEAVSGENTQTEKDAQKDAQKDAAEKPKAPAQPQANSQSQGGQRA